MLKLALNGYGRIGRCVLRALYESRHRERMRIVAINEPADLESMIHLTRFDSTHGRFHLEVEPMEEGMRVATDIIRVCHGTEPEAVDWAGADLLLECSGRFGDRATAERYLRAGVPRLLVSNPMHDAGEVDATVVFGVNEAVLGGRQAIVSNASCTTNCVVPLLHLLDARLGIESASITTVHSAMNDQPVQDGYHRTDLRRTRSAMHSIIPVSTGLARGIERLLPAMSGRVQAHHLRVPTMNVSLMDLNLVLDRAIGADAANALLREAAAGELAGVLAYSDQPHASCDFNHDPHSCIVDGTQTRSTGRLLRLLAWFDNEWGFANRMLDVAACWAQASFRDGDGRVAGNGTGGAFSQTGGSA